MYAPGGLVLCGMRMATYSVSAIANPGAKEGESENGTGDIDHLGM